MLNGPPGYTFITPEVVVEAKGTDMAEVTVLIEMFSPRETPPNTPTAACFKLQILPL